MTRTAGLAGTIRTQLLGCALVMAVVSGAFAVVGASSALAASTTYSSQQNIAVPPAAHFAGAAGGDGWSLAFSQTQVFNIFHHDNILEVSCHNQTDASECWSGPKTIRDGSGNDFGSSGHPGMYLDQSTGKLYTFATRGSDNTGGVVCIDTTSSSPDPFCGFTALTGVGEASFPGMSNLSMPMQVGTKLYSFNYVQGAGVGAGPTNTENTMLCFDLTTDAACAGQPFVMSLGGTTVSSGGFPEPATATIGGKIFIPVATENGSFVACFDPSTGADCTGSWPVSDPSSDAGNYGAPFAMLDSSGTVTGLCLPTGSDPCFNLDGSSAATPTGMTGVVGASASWNGPGVVIGPRVYLANVNDTVECYDYSTSASCTQFPLALSGVGYGPYTVNADPQRPSCLWVNSDSGPAQIQNFDAYSGGLCTETPLRTFAAQFVVTTPACVPVNYTSLQILSPTPDQYSSGSVAFQDADGNSLAPPVSLDGTGTVSLSGLSLNSPTGLPQFLITLNGLTVTPSSIDVQLTWSGTQSPGCAPTPTNQGPPSIAGNPRDGQTLAAIPGNWTYSPAYPPSYSYQWYDCTGASAGSSGTGCNPILGATGPTYTVTPSDVGSSIQVAVSGTSGSNSSSPVNSTVTDAATPGAPAVITVGLDHPSITADGASPATATATVTDANGVPVPNQHVTFSSNGGQTFGSVTDNGDGTYSTGITSTTTAGSSMITAADGRLSSTAPLTQVAGPATQLSLSLSPSSLIANGASTSVATATVTDAYNNPVSGHTVTIVSSGSQLMTPVTEGALPGTYVATITSTRSVGTPTITATDTSVVARPAQSQTLTQTADRAAYVTVLLGDPSITADGTSTTTATALVTDQSGNATVGDQVSFSTDGHQGIGPITDNGDGTYSTVITSTTTAGRSNITATDTTSDPQHAGSASLTQTAGPATTIALNLGNSRLTADGTSGTAATATVTDVNGNPVSGAAVTITSDGGQNFGPVTDNGDGTYSARITSTRSAGSATITAVDTSVSPNLNATQPLTQVSGAGDDVDLTLSPASITADGTSTTQATATVTDPSGNSVTGDQVTFTSSGAQKIGQVSAGAQPGSYLATVTSSVTTGAATITATDNSVSGSPTGTAGLTQTAGAPAHVTVSLNPSSIPADGKSTAQATITVTDANGNPISGAPVSLTSSGGDQIGVVTPTGAPGTYADSLISGTNPSTVTISARVASAAGSAQLGETDPLLTSYQRMPVVQIDTPADGGIYLLHQALGASFFCTDPLGATDVLSCAGPNPAGAHIDTNELGTHAFAVTSVNKAGQTTRVKVHYVVVAARPMPSSPLVYLSGPLSLKDGKISVPVGCLSPTGQCSGGLTLRLTVIGRGASGSVTYRYVTVGSRAYRLRSGRVHVIRVSLSAMGARAFTPGAPLPTIILGVKQLHGAPRRVVIN